LHRPDNNVNLPAAHAITGKLAEQIVNQILKA
jgi:hypothetical protein